MPCNFPADSFHTKKLCSRLSSSEGRFLKLPLGELGATYDDYLKLIGKRVVDFLLVLIELLLLGVTAEELWANIGSKSAISLQRGPVDPKFQVVGVAPTNLDRSFFHFVTNHAFHRRTDGQTEGQTNRILIARPRLHCMQRGNELLISDCS